jgi:hypothetical protein
MKKLNVNCVKSIDNEIYFINAASNFRYSEKLIKVVIYLGAIMGNCGKKLIFCFKFDLNKKKLKKKTSTSFDN